MLGGWTLAGAMEDPLLSSAQDMAPVLVIGRLISIERPPAMDLTVRVFHADPVVGQVINVQCGLLDYRPFVTLPSPSEFAGVQLTVHEIAGAGACTTTVASATQTYNASVVVAPQPVLSIVASDTTVCSSETQAIVKFDFRTSEYMAPLTLSQFTVVAKTSIGTTAARVLCTPGESNYMQNGFLELYHSAHTSRTYSGSSVDTLAADGLALAHFLLWPCIVWNVVDGMSRLDLS